MKMKSRGNSQGKIQQIIAQDAPLRKYEKIITQDAPLPPAEKAYYSTL